MCPDLGQEEYPKVWSMPLIKFVTALRPLVLIGPSLSQFCRLGPVEFRSATPMLCCACVVLRPPNWLATLTQTQLPLEL